MDGTAIAQLGTDRAGTALEKACARALYRGARAAGVVSRQQLRAATRRFARRHRRDAAYLGWVLRSTGTSSALALALLGLAGPTSAALPPFASFAPDPLVGQTVPARSTPALGDLDGDGDLDLVSGDAGGGLHYFANTGSRSSPSFEPRTGAANPLDGFDVGSNAAPALGDLDADGDLDLVVGSDTGTLAYTENTGTGTSPAFAVRTGAASPVGGLVVGIRAAPSLADLDRDGDLDLVVGDLNGGFRWFANTGTAIVPAFAALTGAANPLDGFNAGTSSKPALGDLDRDGDLDLITGRSDGTFLTYENTGSAVSPGFVERTGAANPLDARDVGDRSALALGDLDGDGDADLVAGSDSGAFAAFRNLRSPTAVPEFSGDRVYDPALGDLDGDGDLDLVSFGLKHYRYFENTGSATAASFVQRTGAANPFDGQVIHPLFTTGETACWHPALADLDGDGDLDLGAGRDDGDENPGFCYFENMGSSAHPAFVQRTGASNPLGVLHAYYYGRSRPVFGDLDADGDLDLVASASQYGHINYFENTGSATNPAFVHRLGAANPFQQFGIHDDLTPALGDLDSDGDLDLVATRATPTTGFLYLENTGSAAIPAFVQRNGASNPLSQYQFNAHPAFGDLDADGDLDMLVESVGSFAGRWRIFENTGGPQTPAFIVQPRADPISTLVMPYFVSGGVPVLPDLDHDGDSDLVIGNSIFFENTGSAIAASFVSRAGAANPLPGDSGGLLAFADLDADGDLDLVSGSYYTYPTGFDGFLHYNANTGDATNPQFAPSVANPFGLTCVGHLPAPAIGDLDGDGDFDILVGFDRGNGDFDYFENTGDPSSPAFVQRTGAANPLDGVTFQGTVRLSLADFDLDGDLDLIVGGQYLYNGFEYFRNTGSATSPAFERLTTSPRNPLEDEATFSQAAPAAVDLDADGDFDLVDNTGFLYYAPEPGHGPLFGAGALLLSLLARWRRRS